MRNLKAKSAAVIVLVISAAPALAGESVTYYHNDLAGSPVAATDARGYIMWRASYEPYGTRRQSNADFAASADNKLGFVGQVEDIETGTVYLQARHYDPLIGRFLSTDPVGFKTENLQSFGRYPYANNNPYGYKDPRGMDAVQVGFGTSFMFGVVGFQAGVGLAFDSKGNVAGYGFIGPGGGEGLEGDLNLSAAYSNAATVNDLKGIFYDTSVQGGLLATGSVDIFASPDETVTGVGISLGAGAGESIFLGRTDTHLTPSINIPNLLSAARTTALQTAASTLVGNTALAAADIIGNAARAALAAAGIGFRHVN